MRERREREEGVGERRERERRGWERDEERNDDNATSWMWRTVKSGCDSKHDALGMTGAGKTGIEE